MWTESPYQGYAYAYPHKTAYRPLDPVESLHTVWAGEDKSNLFLYLHIPFCEMRCGFCNLFTLVNAQAYWVDLYLDQLATQVNILMEHVQPLTFARMAIGGGTPTLLSTPQLERLLGLVQQLTGHTTLTIPSSIETSPQTATPDRLALLSDVGFSRISIGVQSFIDAEAHATGRVQQLTQVYTALAAIRQTSIPTLNIDLIYGLPGQTSESWQHTLNEALRWEPEEIYLYPLYVRELTGLDGRLQQTEDDQRLNLYRQGRDYLITQGYIIRSMRSFQRRDAPQIEAPSYSCQEDGMVGLGCGARSYTRALHYSSEWAVSRGGVRAILEDYLKRPASSFKEIHYGFRLTTEEQQRRYVIKSLLRHEGLDRDDYAVYFGADVLTHLPELHTLIDMNLAEMTIQRLHLTPTGLEYSDAIGPFLYSQPVQILMEHYEIH